MCSILSQSITLGKDAVACSLSAVLVMLVRDRHEIFIRVL